MKTKLLVIALLSAIGSAHAVQENIQYTGQGAVPGFTGSTQCQITYNPAGGVLNCTVGLSNNDPALRAHEMQHVALYRQYAQQLENTIRTSGYAAANQSLASINQAAYQANVRYDAATNHGMGSAPAQQYTAPQFAGQPSSGAIPRPVVQYQDRSELGANIGISTQAIQRGHQYQSAPVAYNHRPSHQQHGYSVPRYYAPQVVGVSNTLTISSPSVQMVYQSGPEVVVYQQAPVDGGCTIAKYQATGSCF